MANRFDSVLHERFDAGESPFFSRQLEAIRPGLLEVRYADLKWDTFLPTRVIGADQAQYTVRSYDKVGKSTLASDMSTRAGNVEVKGTESSVLVRHTQSHYFWSVQDMRYAARAGLDLDTRLAMAARRAIEETLDDVFLIGDGTNAYFGMYGLFSTLNSTALSYSVGNGAAGAATFDSKSADEIALNLHGIANGIATNTKASIMPNALVVPLTTYNLINTRRMGDGSNETVLSYFERTNTYGIKVDWSTKLETQGSSSSKRMVCYRKDPDIMEAVLGVRFEQNTPQWEGWLLHTDCHASMAGTQVYQPGAVSYADGI